MKPRFVTQTMHAFLDYPVALSLMVGPFLLKLGSSHPLAMWLAVGTGVAAFILTLFTDHKLGVFRVLPYSVHLAVDFLVGAVFLLAPIVFAFAPQSRHLSESRYSLAPPSRRAYHDHERFEPGSVLRSVTSPAPFLASSSSQLQVHSTAIGSRCVSGDRAVHERGRASR